MQLSTTFSPPALKKRPKASSAAGSFSEGTVEGQKLLNKFLFGFFPTENCFLLFFSEADGMGKD